MSTDDLKQRIEQMFDEELVEMIEVEFGDYRKEALDIARAELVARGLVFDDPSASADKKDSAASGSPAPTCAACGIEMHSATLLAESELTVVFSDGHEERFVNAFACGKCGRLDLMVDFETDVQR